MISFFSEALDIRDHPIKKAKKITREKYIIALTYIVEKTINGKLIQQSDTKKYISERLRLYQTQLFSEAALVTITEKIGFRYLTAFNKPWWSKYRSMLVCDMALLLLDKSLALYAIALFKKSLSDKYQADIDQIFSLLQNKQRITKKYLPIYPLIRQYRANKDFFSKDEKRIIVTANTSAGKSTLINALVGKPIARTSQEVCTGNICYLFNKAFEDGNIQLSTQTLNLNATIDDLTRFDSNEIISIASYFTKVTPYDPRLCIIDTPGVDTTLYKEHSKCTHDALLSNNYDTIIYVVSPTRLGTDAEKKHLQWVAKNLQKNKIIFVLNKLDNYHIFSDSIEKSIHDFKEDLLKIGFENPIICPISAYFSYLLKLKMTGLVLSEDEADEYALYSKKFKRRSYDLSLFYKNVQCLPTDSEEITLSKRVGLYGLEKILYEEAKDHEKSVPKI